jgi:hypothetical protein
MMRTASFGSQRAAARITTAWFLEGTRRESVSSVSDRAAPPTPPAHPAPPCVNRSES